MANQGLTMNPEGIWYFQCRYCDEVFTSSQGIGGHQRKHMPQGTWKKGKRKSTPTVLPGEGRFYRSRSKRNLVHPRSTFHKPQATVLEKPAPTPDPFLIKANHVIHFVKQIGINEDMNVGLATKDDISIP
ncbi:hypothetical protein EJD97_024211 [Solanum chilense]|uniref:C2H2-type domain-containing protein n=1 Tax=Solanum chilense TaxID=4083 RepID=A0A6N2C9T7_SOLCI|nr:hypothetical protein EJD97_024211 [Solanum chilense]